MASPLDALQVMAGQLEALGHPLEAVKCLEACLRLAPMPAQEAQARLRAARLLLAHTRCLPEARQHLQKAAMIVEKLPAHHLLKCEVLAALGQAHKYYGEAEEGFQREAYEKGLHVCSQALAATAGGPDAATRARLQRWVCYFHARTAEALATKGDAPGALDAAAKGLAAAEQYGLGLDELILRLFQLQLCVINLDCAGADAAIQAATAALQRGAAGSDGGRDTPAAQQIKLHFNILQIMYTMRLGRFDHLVKPADGAAQGPPVAISTLEELLDAVKASSAAGDGKGAGGGGGGGGGAGEGGGAEYAWLPLPAQEGLVHLLAACILRAPGKVKEALGHAERGLAAVDGALAELGRAAGAAAAAAAGGGSNMAGGGAAGATAGCAAIPADELSEGDLNHTQVWRARVLVSLRALLLEARLQLRLLQSDFAAARADAAAAQALAGRFPVLLGGLRAGLHMQAGLYAHAVGEWAAAARQYGAAAAVARDPAVQQQAASLAALARLAQGGPEAVGEGIALLGNLYQSPPGSEAGAAERILAQTAGALLRMATPGGGPDQEARKQEAKAALGKALKLAHNRLHNHQMIAQLLIAMAPMRLEVSDLDGAKQMLASSISLAKGMGDLNSQVAALGALQQVYEVTSAALPGGEEAAHNSNYLMRKKAALAAQLAAAEDDAAQHAAVLAWAPGA